MISVAFAASTWIAAYAIEPSRTVLKPLAKTKVAEKAAPLFRKTLAAAAKQTAKATTRVPALRAANAERLTLSLAESLFFRGCIKPITFGGKLWLSYQFIVWTKTVGRNAAKPLASASARMGAKRARALGIAMQAA